MRAPSDFGFFRVAAAVPVCAPAQPRINAPRIAELSQRAADEGARLVVFPELSLTGYTAGDLFLQKRLEDEAREAALWLEQNLPRSIVVVAGVPWRNGGMLFNTAIVFAGGRIEGFVPKTFLPNYKEYYEKRWFVSGLAARFSEVSVGGRAVPFGTDLLFRGSWERQVVFGIEICEDLWVPTPPSSFQALAGAQILLNLSASDEAIGKREYRRANLVAAQSARCLAGMIFVSSGPGESSSDLVFGGHSLIAENGAILEERRGFQSGPTLAVTEARCRPIDRRQGSHWQLRRRGGGEPRAFPHSRPPPASIRSRRSRSPGTSSPILSFRTTPRHSTRAARKLPVFRRPASFAASGTFRTSRPILGLSGGLDSHWPR